MNPQLVIYGLAAVFVVALVVTLIRLLSALKARKEAPAQVPAVSDAPEQAALAAEDEADLTRIKAFSREMLPKLSYDDDNEDEDEVLEQSAPIVLFEGDAEQDVDEPTGQHGPRIAVSAVARTDRGLKRKRNEDAFFVDAKRDLYIVADGMGGTAGGDIASKLAVETVETWMRSPKAAKNPPVPRPRRGAELAAAVESANEAVYARASRDETLTGMGTTLLAARISRGQPRMYIAHVGDTRIYRFREGRLRCITTDHTLAAKGVVGPLGNSVRRAVGVSPSVKVDVIVDKPAQGDLYLMCSDGLYKMLPEDVIASKITEKSRNLDELVDTLIAEANAAGGKDNITALVIQVAPAS